jgi:general secretion pathway protein L
MRSLVVLLPLNSPTGATEFDYVVTADGANVGEHASAPPALLPQPSGAGAEVVAIVPAGALSWHQVILPRGTSGSSPRLRAVLEGLLEERLLDEPDSLHFALQPQSKAGAPVWVAACERAWLRNVLQVLEAAGRPASRIVPEFAPEGPTRVHALGKPDDAQLVVAGEEGVMAAPLAPASLALLPPPDEDTLRTAEPAVAELAEQVLKRPVALQQAPQRWVQAAQSGWDLAQFDLSNSSRARTMKRLAGGWAGLLQAPQWRAVRWGAAMLVLINLIGLNSWAWMERSSIQVKRDSVRRTLTQTFPNVRLVVDPLVQMEKEVAALRLSTGASSGRDMEAMLAALAEAAPDQVVTALEFTGTALRAKGLSGNPEANGVVPRLRSLGYRAVVEGDTLTITPEAAP